jgi:hypothetical protein
MILGSHGFINHFVPYQSIPTVYYIQNDTPQQEEETGPAVGLRGDTNTNNVNAVGLSGNVGINSRGQDNS